MNDIVYVFDIDEKAVLSEALKYYLSLLLLTVLSLTFAIVWTLFKYSGCLLNSWPFGF